METFFHKNRGNKNYDKFILKALNELKSIPTKKQRLILDLLTEAYELGYDWAKVKWGRIP